jgi:hypothetical protein
LEFINGIYELSAIRFNPPENYRELIARLREALSIMDRGGNKIMSMYTDRKYQGYSPNRRRAPVRKRKYKGDAICWVCGKSECHSSKHAPEEKEKSRKLVRQKLTSMLAEEQQASHSSEGSESADESEAEKGPSHTLFTSWTNTSTAFSLLQNRAYEAVPFVGVVFDKGCSHSCTASVSQYLAYCHFVGIKPKICEDATVFNTCGGNVKVFGRANIFVPMAPIQDIVVLKAKLFNSPSTAPILFSMALMNELRIELQNTRSKVCPVDTGNASDIRFVQQLPVYSWDQSKNKDIHHFLLNRDMQRSLFSEAELRNIYRRLGHPTAQRIMRIMERSGRLQDIDPGTRQKMKEIEKNCISCQKHSGPPQRFRFHISNEDGRFNHELIADILFLDNGHVLHVIDAETRFQSAQFITDQKSWTIRKALRRSWIDILQIAPVEAHHLIGMVERNHAVLRKVYENLKLDMPALDRDSLLSMSIRAVNDSTGPDGLIPTARVFGILPRLGIPGEKPTPTMAERVKAIPEATELASREYARRTLTSASRSEPSPNADTVRAVREIIAGSNILVHRENSGWTGPHSVVRMDEDKVAFASKKGVTTVPISVCKPFYENSGYTKSLPIFEASRASELEKHRQLGTFEVVPRVSARGARIFHGTFVDVTKSNGLARSRLVAFATNDNVDYLTESPTMQR